MKNLKKILLVAPLALTSIVAFGGCGEDPHKHNLTMTAAVEATCLNAGNIEYYTCSDCGKYYSDAKAKHELDEGEWVVEALGHTWTDANDHECNNTCGLVRETAVYNMWDGTIANKLPDVHNGVITISTAEELARLAYEVNQGNDFNATNFELGANIDLRHKEWTPIGHGGVSYNSTLSPNSAVFKGSFDGKNHTIYNLRISNAKGGDENRLAAAGVGLFGAVDTAVIKNFKIDTAVVIGNHHVGAAVGFARGTLIENVDVTNVAVSCVYLYEETDGDKAGAIVGYLGNNVASGSELRNCDATNSNINAARDAGQIVGCTAVDYTANDNVVTLTNNTATNVFVSDNNGVQKTNTMDNIKNDIVGSVRHY